MSITQTADTVVSNKRRRRITAKPKSCPNPLFEKWLEELRAEAAQNDSNMRFVYGKALQSLRMYPLPLVSGKECKILKNFGDSICNLLDKKLAKYREEGGIFPPPGTFVDNNEDNNDEPVTEPLKRRKNTKLGSRTTGEETAPPKKSKLYIPAKRSGAYAILVTLYKQALLPKSRGYLTKQELLDLAQPLCDTSFFRPEGASNEHYTAWSSMSLLIKKGLVLKQSSPAKYTLSEEGENLAMKLVAADKDDEQAVQDTQPFEYPNEEVTILDNPQCAIEKSPSSSTTNGACSSSTLSEFTYTYISEQGQEVRQQDLALVRIDDDGFVGFLVKCDLQLLRQTSKQYRYDKRETSGEAFVYLRDTDCDLVAPLSARECNSFPRTSSVTSSFTSMSSFKRCESQSSTTSATTSISRSTSSSNLATAASVVATSCTLHPGEFDVVLCVDTAETSGAQGGGRGTQKDLTLGELQRQGVRYEIRKLNVGDYVWICKPKNSSSQELVLPYVIERKRLDDLGSSIKDGRFKEQKFRLKSCGMSVIYLVEDLPSRQHLGLPESSVLQAIANTHIVDGINVKWTKDIRESIAYLNLMTRQLQVKYQNQVLRNGESLVTFAEFNVQGVKNKPMTVTDLFAKQLLQFNGISADKARAIVDRYPTPSALKAALDRCSSNQEKELLLSSVPYGKTKRMLGPALSKLLAWFYSRSNLE